MNTYMEELAGIEPGDSNEVCLAKTMLAIRDNWNFLAVNGNVVIGLLGEGEVYASEVLDARA